MFMMMMMKVPDFRLQLSDIIKINTVGKKRNFLTQTRLANVINCNCSMQQQHSNKGRDASCTLKLTRRLEKRVPR